MRLSPHFTLAEATKSHVALRNSIDNTPPQTIIPHLQTIAEEVLEPVRKNFNVPFSPSSWYRCPALNAAIRSKPNSAHVTGRAVDFEIPGISNVDLARWCAAHLTFDQLLLEFHDLEDPASGWVHCAIANSEEYTGARGEVLTVTRNGVLAGLPA